MSWAWTLDPGPCQSSITYSYIYIYIYMLAPPCKIQLLSDITRKLISCKQLNVDLEPFNTVWANVIRETIEEMTQFWRAHLNQVFGCCGPGAPRLCLSRCSKRNHKRNDTVLKPIDFMQTTECGPGALQHCLSNCHKRNHRRNDTV